MCVFLFKEDCFSYWHPDNFDYWQAFGQNIHIGDEIIKVLTGKGVREWKERYIEHKCEREGHARWKGEIKRTGRVQCTKWREKRWREERMLRKIQILWCLGLCGPHLDSHVKQIYLNLGLLVWVKVFILICGPHLNEISEQEVRGVAVDALIKDNSRSFGGGTSVQF